MLRNFTDGSYIFIYAFFMMLAGCHFDLCFKIRCYPYHHLQCNGFWGNTPHIFQRRVSYLPVFTSNLFVHCRLLTVVLLVTAIVCWYFLISKYLSNPVIHMRWLLSRTIQPLRFVTVLITLRTFIHHSGYADNVLLHEHIH